MKKLIPTFLFCFLLAQLFGQTQKKISTLLFAQYNKTIYGATLGNNPSGIGLGLQTFFTAGDPEVRAWTIHQGDTAPKAAGVIHTDFERGFIRAETASYDDFVANDGWRGAREKGFVRSEGKEYVVQDGDVMLFRFNV